MSFAAKYGPWAVVAGASDGVGSAFAEELAERGLNVVLLARRTAVLDAVAAGIRDRTGVQTRTLTVDLATDDAASAIAEATADLDVGFLVYCAGADPKFERFLANSVEAAESMISRNCTTPTRLCHHYAQPMVARGRGGIVLVGSGAGFAGAPNMVAYGATKAFGMVFAEALWAEVHEQGVDVLGLILGKTDTPALRKLEHERGLIAEIDQPLPEVTTAAEVVAAAFANLENGPTHFAGKDVRAAEPMMRSLTRNELVRMMVQASAASMGD